MKSIILVIAVVIAGVWSQSPCTIPNQFMTGLTYSTFDANECNSASAIQMLYYDFPNQQLRVDSTATVGGDSYTFTTWIDFNKEMGYYYDRDTDSCTSFSVTGDLPDTQLPDDSSYMGTVLVGTEAVDNWLTPDDNDVGFYEFIGLAEVSCWPIYAVALNDTTNQVEANEQYFNFVPQLPPFYFDIPDICTSMSTVGEMPAHIAKRLKYL